MRFLSSVIALLCLCGSASADLDECYRSTCKIRAGGGAGSGCVYAVDATYAYILTNYHVAGGPGTRVTVTFVARGFSSNPLAAETVWHSFSPSHHRDMAVVRVPLASFGSRVPKPIPLAKPGYQVKPGQTITTVGCPNAQWPSARVGHADSVESDIIVFTPAAIPGQSGSAIFDESGSFIVGLIAWSDGGHGIGMTSDEIWKASRGEGPTLYRMKGVQAAALEDVQCPDGSCAPGRMPSHPPSGGINPFPGLPDDEPIRPAPTVPINPPKVEPPAQPVEPATPSVEGCKCDPHALRELTIRVQRVEGSLDSAAKTSELLAKHLEEVAKSVKESQLAAQQTTITIQRIDARLALLEKRPTGEKQSGQFRIKFQVDPATGTIKPIE
jgi:hypothetical protein